MTRRRGDYTLTAKQAEALALHDAGLSSAEIARRLGVAANLISNRVRRARLLQQGAAIAALQQARRRGPCSSSAR
jgi:DNA-directed RNA polymerase specialized sigma24 family protein